MLNSEDISVVIQGAINSDIIKTLKSVRKFLPKSEIILSTWENSKVENLSCLCDVLLLNKDPNAVVFDISEQKYNNLNRILVSSKNGIEKASRKYVLRLRSDLILKNNNVLTLFDDFEIRNPQCSLFKKRIFAYAIFSIKYDVKKNLKQEMLFHISDWCYFGLKEDLQELFDIPLVDEPEFSNYFKNHKKTDKDIFPSRLWKMSPEQYITSMNAKKVFENFEFSNYLDINFKNIEDSENFIINNFRIFSKRQWGIYSLKKLYKDIDMTILNPTLYYSQTEQLYDYQKYSKLDKTVVKQESRLYQLEYFENLRKHFLLLFICECSLNKKFSELFSFVYYLWMFNFALIRNYLCK